ASLADGTIVAAEALLRWRDPKRGLVQPGEFVAALEETGLIVQVGNWALRRACTDAAAWPRPIRVAVNVAAAQLAAGDYVARVAEALAASGLDPARLEIEITESALVHDDDALAVQFARLRATGVGLAIDDFGTGYSSLAYVKRFPVGKIKVDRAFVKDLPGDPESVAIVQAVSAIARALGLKVTAEGVETKEQADAVRLLGCDDAQGFLFARPLPAVAFAKSLAPVATPARGAA
ncbi:MAG: EAL domain-containing protein, partial [Hyphomicrobiales bacterium]|nr:EAL domain-containing protein [Hyphomicrobiales bacterium]